MSEGALITLAAMLTAGIGYKLGKGAGGPKPKGAQVQNADIAKEAKVTCKRCRGKGAVSNGEAFDLCGCALLAFNRRHGHEVVSWRGDMYWTAPRA